ncbi:YihY/virulence factor BrkB family protein [Pseudoduganella chitinolytica]|uniref:YihY/virulence factor BrkB family protein n=1 Tax=Pseudoduganella chitinolytica TaxID=34070 RepID=A0ABY8BKC3_9BURK|nr:YihY/virulence factor BrkB family protein [Pseudoduganella chitinolytica]WEF35413.1 YihY/virulence factor BrkB family protein [Pseudoduganella chitinolytica]
MSWRKFPHIAKKLPELSYCAVMEWFDHRGSSKGAALAFYTLFSLAPILVLVIAIAGFFYGKEAAQGELFNQLRGMMGAQGAEAIQLILAGAHNEEEGRIATIIAGALLLFGATSVFAELKTSLDDIWQLPPVTDNTVWDTIRTRLLSFGMVLALGFLLLTSLVVSAALEIFQRFWTSYWPQATFFVTLLNHAISFLVIATMFGVIYKMLPRIRLGWTDVIIGAIGTALLFMIGKFGIGAYIGNSGVTSSFGAAGSTIALLLWVYYSAQIFFLGAEFARQYALRLGSLKHHPRDEQGRLIVKTKKD